MNNRTLEIAIFFISLAPILIAAPIFFYLLGLAEKQTQSSEKLIFLFMPVIFLLMAGLLSNFISSKFANWEKSHTKQKSYSDEMQTYDHLQVKEVDYLPTPISLDELMQNDGEIPERAEGNL